MFVACLLPLQNSRSVYTVAWEDDLYDQPPGNWGGPPPVVLRSRLTRKGDQNDDAKSLGNDDTKSFENDDTKSLGVEPDVEATLGSRQNGDHAKTPREQTSDTTQQKKYQQKGQVSHHIIPALM